MDGIKVPVDEVLDKLDHGRNWIQGSWSEGDKMCLHQGIRLCQEQAGDAFIIEEVAEHQGWGPGFNDNDETTFDDVKQRLVEHREVLPHELEEVFGPQWLEIVALVRRAATLTEAEIMSLTAAWDAAAGDAARAAAGDAAWAARAARAAAWDAAARAARAAAGDAWAAWAAAGATAAGDAAGALATRNLVGSDTYTQEHYDLLIKPWATVVGPAHPEDATR